MSTRKTVHQAVADSNAKHWPVDWQLVIEAWQTLPEATKAAAGQANRVPVDAAEASG